MGRGPATPAVTGLEHLRRPVVRLQLPVPAREPAARPRAERIGLLGGSFNPSHEGHLYVSLEALKLLRLDRIWWLVSPQNPLKPVAGMAPFAERLARARDFVRHPRIEVSDIEARLGTRYTIDTLKRLQVRRDRRFVWLIGADNLVQMPAWRHWRALFRRCPVAVFERSPYSYGALGGKAAVSFARARVGEERLDELADLDPPAWAFVRLRPHPASSTAIRRGDAPYGTVTRET
jgi:nicotinate-nucleotide adenylyltransferase